jgi:SNF2 family DNA or RNA helicase
MGLDYALPRDRIALFMQMRCGKCLVTIRWAASKLDAEKILIVAPNSCILGWQDELSQEGYESLWLRGPGREKEAFTNTLQWNLISYASLRNSEEIAQAEWDCVVLDESTIIKNPTSEITKVCVHEMNHIKYKAILSGHPAPEGVLDYFCQMQFLYGRWMNCESWYQFRHKYFTSGYNGWTWYENKGVRKKIKAAVQNDAFVLTRKKAGIGSKKIRETRYVYMTKKQKRIYESVENDFEFPDEGSETKWIIVVRNWLAQVAGGYADGEWISKRKINELMSLLQGELKDEQVVVWFRYRRELAAVWQELKKAGIPAVWIWGDPQQCSPKERERRRKKFQAGKARVLLAIESCAKYGLDCSAADTAIYYSNEYSGEARTQSEDRIIHALKKAPVLIIDLVTKGTVDEDVLYALRQKRTDAQYFLQNFMESFRRRVCNGVA